MKRFFIVLILLLGLISSNLFSQTFYITKTGKKYHKENCGALKQTRISISLDEAISNGYGACLKCKPGGSTVYETSTEPQKGTQCIAFTKSGTRCTRPTNSPSKRCWQHGGG